MVSFLLVILALAITVTALALRGPNVKTQYVCGSNPLLPVPEACVTAFEQEPADTLCEENQQAKLLGCSTWQIDGQTQSCTSGGGQEGMWCECKFICMTK